MTIAPDRHAPAPTTPHARGSRRTEAHHVERNSRLATTSAAPRERSATKRSGRPNPMAGLTDAQIEEIGRELDALRAEVMTSRGAADAAYIRRVIKAQRYLELGSRAVLTLSGVKVKGVRPAWWLGTAGLTAAKILENMEIGHNVMHGQWDWMRDPKIHSRQWEWDNASPSSQWKHAHNEIHHTYTNVLGRDNDLGYGILRVDEAQRWTLFYLAQPVWHLINALVFEYSIAAYDLELGAYVAKRKRMTDEQKAEFRANANEVLGKIRAQVVKDYLLQPLLAGPGARHALTATVTANILRNLWTNTVIICGHFPEGIETFDKASIEGETRGEWYVRQMLGSGNISGGPLMHLMSGNLSHQIEHHVYPDMPSNRYAQVAPRIRAIMERNGLPYRTGPLHRQAASVYKKVFLLALPNKEPGRSRRSVVAQEIRDALRGKKEGKTRQAPVKKVHPGEARGV